MEYCQLSKILGYIWLIITEKNSETDNFLANLEDNEIEQVHINRINM